MPILFHHWHSVHTLWRNSTLLFSLSGCLLNGDERCVSVNPDVGFGYFWFAHCAQLAFNQKTLYYPFKEHKIYHEEILHSIAWNTLETHHRLVILFLRRSQWTGRRSDWWRQQQPGRRHLQEQWGQIYLLTCWFFKSIFCFKFEETYFHYFIH